jgi:hypothetical protein
MVWDSHSSNMKEPNVDKTDQAMEFRTKTIVVATLALGSRPRQRGCKSAGQEEARESHHILLGV